jgi:hypothetical protein
MKKRLFAVLASVVAIVFALPSMALAQDGSGSGLGPPEGPEVAGTGGSIGGAGGVGGSAFTGADITGLVALAVLLVLVGVGVLFLARRRGRGAIEVGN